MCSESQYIDGIYNYCDRWCERCPFTARCRTFAMEQEFERAEREGRDPEDIDWEAFWKSVGLSFDNTPPEWLGEFPDEDDGPEYDLGITFTESEGDDWESDDWLEEREEDKHPLVARAHDYMKLAHQWLREHARGWAEESTADPPASAVVDESDLKVQDAIAVVSWYHTMIPAKVTRSISGPRTGCRSVGSECRRVP